MSIYDETMATFFVLIDQAEWKEAKEYLESKQSIFSATEFTRLKSLVANELLLSVFAQVDNDKPLPKTVYGLVCWLIDEYTHYERAAQVIATGLRCELIDFIESDNLHNSFMLYLDMLIQAKPRSLKKTTTFIENILKIETKRLEQQTNLRLKLTALYEKEEAALPPPPLLIKITPKNNDLKSNATLLGAVDSSSFDALHLAGRRDLTCQQILVHPGLTKIKSSPSEAPLKKSVKSQQLLSLLKDSETSQNKINPFLSQSSAQLKGQQLLSLLKNSETSHSRIKPPEQSKSSVKSKGQELLSALQGGTLNAYSLFNSHKEIVNNTPINDRYAAQSLTIAAQALEALGYPQEAEYQYKRAEIA